MKRFILISASKPLNFEREVELALSKGYEPYGNIAVMSIVKPPEETREYYATFMRLNDDIWEVQQKTSKTPK